MTSRAEFIRGLRCEPENILREAAAVCDGASGPGAVKNGQPPAAVTQGGVLASGARTCKVCIAGLDRQACGGTHLTNTAGSAPIRITKVENKGRRNRRIRIALA